MGAAPRHAARALGVMRTFYRRVVLVDEVALDELDGETTLSHATATDDHQLVFPQELRRKTGLAAAPSVMCPTEQEGGGSEAQQGGEGREAGGFGRAGERTLDAIAVRSMQYRRRRQARRSSASQQGATAVHAGGAPRERAASGNGEGEMEGNGRASEAASRRAGPMGAVRGGREPKATARGPRLSGPAAFCKEICARANRRFARRADCLSNHDGRRQAKQIDRDTGYIGIPYIAQGKRNSGRKETGPEAARRVRVVGR